MNDPGTDPRSQLCVDLITAGSYSSLVVPSNASRADSPPAGVTPQQLLAVPPVDMAAAWAMLAGLWLWHDALDESHQIAQKSPDELRNPTPKSSLSTLPGRAAAPQSFETAASTLNFWHAIMHRREGDFPNSKYWYARCRNHPTLSTLTNQAAQILHPLAADKRLLRLINPSWDPDAFVDLVESVHRRPLDPLHATAVALQQLEWRLLFDHCTRAAAGQ